jgi:hypothetical protein
VTDASGHLSRVRAHLDLARECLREGDGKSVRVDTALEAITRATRQLEKAQRHLRVTA